MQLSSLAVVTLSVVLALVSSSTDAFADPAERELAGFTTAKRVGLIFKVMNGVCAAEFGEDARMCMKRQIRRTQNPPTLPQGDIAWVQGEPNVTHADVSTSSKRAAEEAAAVAGALGAIEGTIAIDFGQTPVPDGPAASLVVEGVTLTAKRQNETLDSTVQRSNKGAGVASGQNVIQDGEALFLEFGSEIQLRRFVLWFNDAGAADPFSVEIGDGLSFDAVGIESESGPLTVLPPDDQASAAGRWFRYDVSGTPTGSVLKFRGTDASSAFRVKRVQLLPEDTGEVPPGGPPPTCRGWNEGGLAGVIYTSSNRFGSQPCWHEARIACCVPK